MQAALLLLLVLASAASAQIEFAQFTLDSPVSRGGFFSADGLLDVRSYCGGWPNATLAVADRSVFSLDGGQVSMFNYQTSGEVSLFISFEEAPTTWEEFNRTSLQLGGVRKLDSWGQWCLGTNVTELVSSGSVRDGTLATIQVMLTAQRRPLGGQGSPFYTGYSCADVVLSSTVAPPNLTCQHTVNSAVGRAVELGGLLWLLGLVALVL